MSRDRVLSKSVIAPSVRMSLVHPINDIHPSKNTHYVHQFWLDHKFQALIREVLQLTTYNTNKY